MNIIAYKTKLLSISVAFLLSVALLLSSGCEGIFNDVVQDIDMPNEDPKLVVHAHLNPSDTIISVTVSRSKPIFNRPAAAEPEIIPDAQVKIECGSNSMILTFDWVRRAYFGSASSLQLAPGKTAKISVSAPGFKSVSGQTTIPSVKNVSLEIVSVTEVTEYDMVAKRVKIKFRDIAGEKNFYRICGVVDDDGSGSGAYLAQLSLGQEYISDSNKDGEEIIASIDFPFYGTPTFRILLLTTDEMYYRYHYALNNYTWDNPFAEPTVMPSNINNGIGVITSYLSFSKQVN